MGVVFTGARRSITPSLTNDNYTLDAPANKICYTNDIWAGGEMTATTAMHTRWTRASGQVGAGTAVTAGFAGPNFSSNGVAMNSTYATTQPTLAAYDLFAESWNSHGGVVRYLFAPEEWWYFIGAAATTASTLSCRNTVGTGTSSYGCVWTEN